jgi:alkanesulfonate monooxygenase SsuD/methylene tetrahydromethanopterin reductase-like flavin-dependent oxidoreductase (luciferase family)
VARTRPRYDVAPSSSAGPPRTCGPANALAGTPEEVVEQIGRYAALGAQRVYLQVLDQHDLDHLRLLAAEVMPHV